ncbi:MAG: DUF4325 domain-containing protein [Clostridia bacterium]|nr:DUF4325 domain-containing protein [Clostridia bacterium]
MVNIAVRKIVNRCVTNDDGDVLFLHIQDCMKNGSSVNVSFDDVDSVSSSFVNSAFIKLLDYYSFDDIKKNLIITNSNSHINTVIKRRFYFETSKKTLVNNDKACCCDHAPCEACV